jgi:hypothetical protein
MTAAIITDPLVADLLDMADDAIEHRAPGSCADCISRGGSPCADHVADNAMVAKYERIRARAEAGEIGEIVARGGNDVTA